MHQTPFPHSYKSKFNFIPFHKILDWTEFKGGYLDFSHLIKLKNIYITEIHMEKQYKSPIIKNHKITFFFFFFFMVFPLKAMWPLKLFVDFAPEIKESIVGISCD